MNPIGFTVKVELDQTHNALIQKALLRSDITRKEFCVNALVIYANRILENEEE